eukprot:247870_1
MLSKIGSLKNMLSKKGNTSSSSNTNANDGGIWSWNNNGHWQPFDAVASKQIDTELRNQWLNTNQHALVFPLTKGPWFSQSKNRGIYFCNVQLNASRDKITGVVQQNTRTGFARQMTRKPLFACPGKGSSTKRRLSGIFKKKANKTSTNSNKNNNNNAAITIQAFGNTINSPVMDDSGGVCWSWRNDYQWEAYDPKTIAQVEAAYQAQEKSVVLNQGPFFGSSKRKGLYMVLFDEGNTIPACFTQINTQTRFARQVTRTEGGVALHMDMNDSNESKQDKWRSYYRPMTSACFKKLKDKEKICNICFLEFEEKELFENQCEEFKTLVQGDAPKESNTNSAMNDKEEMQDVPSNDEPIANNVMNEDANDKEEIQDGPLNDELITNDVMNEDTNEDNTDNNQKTNDINEAVPPEEDSDGDSVMLDTVATADDNANPNVPETIEENDAKEDPKENAKDVGHIKISKTLANQIENDTIIHLSKCNNDDHYFHRECITRWLNEKGKCCHCQTRYAIETGNQPTTGRVSWSFIDMPCRGFKKCGTIKIGFEFEGGMQGEEHYHPGQTYSGDMREVYFPNNEQGRQALELTKIAWNRRLIFTVGTSLTTKRENCIVWTSLHFKTRLDGGQEAHGWPDDTYFDRFEKELEAKGVTVNDIDDDTKDRIKNGYQ